jgi:hypothetical protein
MCFVAAPIVIRQILKTNCDNSAKSYKPIDLRKICESLRKCDRFVEMSPNAGLMAVISETRWLRNLMLRIISRKSGQNMKKIETSSQK